MTNEYNGIKVVFKVNSLHDQVALACHFAVRQSLWNHGLLNALWSEVEVHGKVQPAENPNHAFASELIQKAQHSRFVANSLLPANPTAEQVKDLLLFKFILIFFIEK